jgi:hypothetical protein
MMLSMIIYSIMTNSKGSWNATVSKCMKLMGTELSKSYLKTKSGTVSSGISLNSRKAM